MDDSHNWRGLLYPGEWAFRFFIGALLVWLVRLEFPEPIAAAVFYVLTIGVLAASVLQVGVLVGFARAHAEGGADRHS